MLLGYNINPRELNTSIKEFADIDDLIDNQNLRSKLHHWSSLNLSNRAITGSAKLSIIIPLARDHSVIKGDLRASK